MNRICNQCQTEMVDGCSLNIEGGLQINIKKNTGLFNSVSAKPKVLICPNCGCVVLYIDEYKDFVK